MDHVMQLLYLWHRDLKNSLPLLEGIGQFGSLRSTEAGAPRYISVKLNKKF